MSGRSSGVFGSAGVAGGIGCIEVGERARCVKGVRRGEGVRVWSCGSRTGLVSIVGSFMRRWKIGEAGRKGVRWVGWDRTVGYDIFFKVVVENGWCGCWRSTGRIDAGWVV